MQALHHHARLPIVLVDGWRPVHLKVQLILKVLESPLAADTEDEPRNQEGVA